MRLPVALVLLSLAACASEKLEQAPPAGVDFTGHWKLNEADSDDPQRLVQSEFDTPATSPGASPSGGGRGGRQGGRVGGAGGPVMPSAGLLGEGLRWPGKQLEVKQVAGVVAFSSDGYNRVCQPTDGEKPHRRHRPSSQRNDPSSRRDALPSNREVPPPRCGWEQKTLIVQGGDPDDDRTPFEEKYSLSEDGQRLIEVVGFNRGRSNGFSMSRVWDRSSQ